MHEDTDAAGRLPLWEAQSWLRAHTLESLVEVNEQCLELLREQAAVAAPDQPLLRDLGALWRELDADSRRRAAGCAVLLLDAGFTDAAQWSGEIGCRVHDRERVSTAPAFFTVPRTMPVMRLVLTYAWHLARSESAAARLLLGMSARCLDLIGSCTLNRVARLAETRPHWLKPRWQNRPRVWRDLLVTAAAGEPAALDRMRLRGLQLLAAEARAG